MKKLLVLLFLSTLIISSTGCGSSSSNDSDSDSSDSTAACTLELKYSNCSVDSGIIYVNSFSTAESPDGSSWSNAYPELTDALDSACQGGGDEIWVAQGTYYPSSSENRCALFEMISGVSIYGGFAGSETTRTARDVSNNTTTLSGDIDKDSELDDDNSYHVVYGASNAVLDGFTITMGYAVLGSTTPSDYESYDGIINVASGHEDDEILRIVKGTKYIAGGGMLNLQTAPTVNNCIFENNYASKGGAVYNMAASDYPTNGASYEAATFSDCIFRNNSASDRGGAINNDMSTNPTFLDSQFISNSCDSKGGAVYSDMGCDATFVNVLFAENTAERGAALVSDGSSNPYLIYVTMYNNTATDIGAALYQGTYGASGQTGGNISSSNDPKIIMSMILGNISHASGTSISNWLDDSLNVDTNTPLPQIEYTDSSLTASTYIDTSTYEPQSGYSTIGYSSTRDYSTDSYTALLSRVSSRIYDAYPYDTNSTAGTSAVYFVDAYASGANNGSNWSDAFPDLQTALGVAGSGDQIWVAQGTYYPSSGSDRATSFVLPEGVLIYGGFNGTETLLSERNPSSYVTILSGDIGTGGDDTDNSYHVVVGSNASTIDGFTITGGYADGEWYHQRGAGMIIYGDSDASSVSSGGVDMTISNCTFTNNYAVEGGGIANYNYATPTISASTFSGNSAKRGGAILFRTGSDATLSSTVFTSNTASDRGGAVFIDYGASPTFSSCEFTGNSSTGYGGAVYVDDNASQITTTSPTFTSCSFDDNSASGAYGGAFFIYNTVTDVTITSCSFGTTTANSSATDGADLGCRYSATVTLSGNTGLSSQYNDGCTIQ